MQPIDVTQHSLDFINLQAKINESRYKQNSQQLKHNPRAAF
jgi:hypothetical protein